MHLLSAGITDEIEDIATDIVSQAINTIISKNHKLYIYKPIERIVVKTNTVNDNYFEYEIYSRWFEDEEKTVSLGDL